MQCDGQQVRLARRPLPLARGAVIARAGAEGQPPERRADKAPRLQVAPARPSDACFEEMAP